MDKANYGDNRWKIIYGSYENCEKYAIDKVYGAVSQCVPYILTLEKSSDIDMESLKNINPIFVGSVDSNKYISSFVKDKLIEIPDNEEGFVIKVTKSIFNSEKQMIIIAGQKNHSLLYAANDFLNIYVSKAYYTHDHDRYFRDMFQEEMPEIYKKGTPKINNRAIWTWGHVIYDYEKFIDNMVRLKFNMLVLWNDYPPVNSNELVKYAHDRGIKVIWGFSWGWGEKIDISNQGEVEIWAQRILKNYEENYANLNGDGIYFQTFTETNSSTLNNVVIADAVTSWVNKISSLFYEKYPDIEIQFGIHATSVKDQLDYLKNVDKRIHIVWEDCGAFPYAYSPYKTENFEQTKELNQKICELRGNDDRFGAVLKGFTCLHWPAFEHQKGQFILGRETNNFIKERTEFKRKYWKCVQAFWLKNAYCAKEIIDDIAILKKGNATLEVLIEDGMLESKIWFPVALYSELLWEQEGSLDDLKCDVALASDVEFA